MTRGERWTPAYDRLFDPSHELAGEPVCRRWAFLDLCHMARFEPGVQFVKGTAVHLDRGELLVSERYLATRWRWSRGKVRRFLATLADRKLSKIRPTNETTHGTIYTVVSYDTYALDRPRNRPSDGTSDGPPTDQRTNSIYSSSPSTGDVENSNEGEFQRAFPSLNGAAGVLEGLHHPGGAKATIATLRTSFLYESEDLANPDPSVRGAPLPRRTELVQRALLEMRDQGKDKWSARLLAGFVRRAAQEPTAPSSGGSPAGLSRAEVADLVRQHRREFESEIAKLTERGEGEEAAYRRAEALIVSRHGAVA